MTKPDVKLEDFYKGFTAWRSRRKCVAEMRISKEFGTDAAYFPREIQGDARACAVHFGKMRWGKEYVGVGRAEWIRHADGTDWLHASIIFWKEVESGDNP